MAALRLRQKNTAVWQATLEAFAVHLASVSAQYKLRVFLTGIDCTPNCWIACQAYVQSGSMGRGNMQRSYDVSRVDFYTAEG